MLEMGVVGGNQGKHKGVSSTSNYLFSTLLAPLGLHAPPRLLPSAQANLMRLTLLIHTHIINTLAEQATLIHCLSSTLEIMFINAE